MSMSGDFNPPDGDFNSGPNYPSAFGITFTPMISGICLGVLGLAAAAYGWMTFVDPLRIETEALDAKVKEKTAQLGDSQKIEADLKKAKVRLAQVEQQRQQVMSLFAQPKNMDTILLDLNQLIKRNNAGILEGKRTKLASCPDWVKEQFTTIPDGQRFEESIGPFVADAKLLAFRPSPTAPGGPAAGAPVPNVVTDGSLGAELNNKLKRETVEVAFEGNFNQTQQIFRTIERLQPLLVMRNMAITVGRSGGGSSPILYELNSKSPIPEALRDCQPDTVLKTLFKMDALIPVTPEEAKLLVPSPTASPSPGATPSPSTPPKK
jgi:type IV pilus assembly protein PilO